MKLLHIIASPRGNRSRTLSISNEFLGVLQSKYSDLIVETLNLSEESLPVLDGASADAKYMMMGGIEPQGEAKNRFKVITKYATDFLSYDLYLITSPMWNFSVPYQLKHYIDIIMQPGYLFRFTEQGVEGLAKNKKMFCITTRGNDYSPGSYMNQFDFQEPYLRSIFGMTGITDVTFINAQPMDVTMEIAKANLDKAFEDTKVMVQAIS
ncbi:MAG: NAD(P)H-dependent oxidoreductase [Bacteroidia bacterium]